MISLQFCDKHIYRSNTKAGTVLRKPFPFFHPSAVSYYQPQKGSTVNGHNLLKIIVILKPQRQKEMQRIVITPVSKGVWSDLYAKHTV